MNSRSHLRCYAIDRIALAYRAEVDSNAGPLKMNCERLAIEQQPIGPDERSCRFDLGGVRHTPLSSKETPALTQRAGCNIECSFGLETQPAREKQQSKKRGFDWHRMRCRGAVDLADFTAVSEDGELLFVSVGVSERAAGEACTGAIGTRQSHFEAAG